MCKAINLHGVKAKQFDLFLRALGLKAALFLIQREGKELTKNNEDPDEMLVKKIPRYTETLDGLASMMGYFCEQDIENAMIRVLADAAKIYGVNHATSEH